MCASPFRPGIEAHMPTTLRSLLAHDEFALRTVTGFDDQDVMDRAISWVHSSDLADPTPWLEPDQLLLTDGMQFLGDAPVAADDYVERLRSRGVLALGFATAVAHDAVPEGLVRACRASGFPLVEVAERTPFIAIIRHVADVIAADRHEQLEWSRQAQRVVARAAMRPDGLRAVLRALEQQLRTWAVLFDAAGRRMLAEGGADVPPALAADIDEAVRLALQRGATSGGRVQRGDAGATFQTLGQRGRLRGVLVVGSPAPPDAAEHDLISSVIGLASIALEQSSTLETARLRVRAGVFELLLAGVFDVARETADRLWDGLPAVPFRAVVVRGEPGPERAALSELEVRADGAGGEVFHAQHEGDVVVLTAGGAFDGIVALAERHGLHAGVSTEADWGELDRALTEARRALERATPERPVVAFADLADEGIIGFLEAAGATPLARRMLAPLLEPGRPERAVLLRSLEVWLRHNGAWDPAARELEVHRHTLRNRLRTVEELLQVDLARFADRAELWTALRLLEGRRGPDAIGSATVRA
ncbi:PucR family transcriptional regulator [Pseudoclavibacter chungangensis]|uniref:PucR family transcriptional regulator n=2 Tax=Pseudoclavibacter chungangensis TaxID=587635 RepID=A0A7J5BRA0_9MICO|nr:PucR family transcriptional regulator [Pseudoclavibacter chungangensis]